MVHNHQSYPNDFQMMNLSMNDSEKPIAFANLAWLLLVGIFAPLEADLAYASTKKEDALLHEALETNSCPRKLLSSRQPGLSNGPQTPGIWDFAVQTTSENPSAIPRFQKHDGIWLIPLHSNFTSVEVERLKLVSTGEKHEKNKLQMLKNTFADRKENVEGSCRMDQLISSDNLSKGFHWKKPSKKHSETVIRESRIASNW